MAEFDPSKPALVHDALNDQTIDWKPELYRQNFERHARPDFKPGVTAWDGLLLDGWREHQDRDQPGHRYAIGKPFLLTERDRVDVQRAVDSRMAGWNAVARVTLANAHTIEIIVHGVTPDQQNLLAKEIWREAQRIDKEHS